MNMPCFAAEIGLYKTSGHYRTHKGRQAAQMISPISPALWQRPETVEIHSCPVGWSDFGGTCYPPLTEPPVGGVGEDLPPGGERPEDGPGGGGDGEPYGTKKPPRGSHPCTGDDRQFDPKHPLYDGVSACFNGVPKNPDPRLRYLAWCGPGNGEAYCCLVRQTGKPPNVINTPLKCDPIKWGPTAQR
jgi:hypothetical protein